MGSGQPWHKALLRGKEVCEFPEKKKIGSCEGQKEVLVKAV